MGPQVGQPTVGIDAEAKEIEDEEQRDAFYDHPSAHLCYAWEVDGQVTAVLHIGPAWTRRRRPSGHLPWRTNPMGKQRMIGGCLVLQEAPAQAWRYNKVVLCEIRVPLEAMEQTDTYVVWYIDPKGKPSRAR